MSKTFRQFKKTVNESAGIADSFICHGKKVVIYEDFKVKIDDVLLDFTFNELDEARDYTRDFISDSLVVEEIEETYIPEEHVASLIKKHHKIQKITDTLIESYTTLASSNSFSADPVIFEMKTVAVNSLPNKINWTLNDGSNVAVDIATQETLNRLLENKTEVVEYMRESRDNFISIVREVI